MRPEVGVTVTVLTWEVSKQKRWFMTLHAWSPRVLVHSCGPPELKPSSPCDPLEFDIQSLQVVLEPVDVPVAEVAVQTVWKMTPLPFSSRFSECRILPAVMSETWSANGDPSVRMKPRALPSLVTALRVEVESQAL